MNRYSIPLLLLVCAGPVRGEDRSPEQILPSTTQVYARWDGVAAHRKAYDESALGKMFAGETGQAFDELWSHLRRQLKLTQVGDPLLEGQSPDELQKALADVKAIVGLPKLLAKTGVVVGFEIRPPGYDLGTIYKLIKSNAKDREQMKSPYFVFTVIVPGGGDKSELLAAVRMLIKESKASIKNREIAGRKVISHEVKNGDAAISTWSEATHFVLTVSNIPIERIVARIKNAGAGITNHALYKQVVSFQDFRTVFRGYIDVGNIVTAFEKVIKAYEPALWPIIDATGATGVKSICIWNGFEGLESRGAIEIDTPGPRKGLMKIFKPVGLKPADLPPLPADLTRFAATRMDLAEIYDLIPLIAEIIDGSGSVDPTIKPEEQFRKRKEKLLQEMDDAVGIKMIDLFAALGDKVVTYQAPTDGILNLGQVLAISVKDEKALRRCLDSLIRKLESSARGELALKKRDCLGIEVREFVIRERSPVTVSYAICDGWLVIGLQPQPVRGFIHRSKGKLPTWKPDARTAASLAKVPADRCIVQVADPRVTLQWLYGAAPVIAGLLGRKNNEPVLDPGLFPHAGEACQHLFPNVMWCRDDGKKMRFESRDSLWLPLEFMGVELVGVYFGVLGGIFR